jgi:pimeloyl-ACP methyl ester carboxylesterase
MLDPKNMWLGMAAIAAVFVGWKVLAPTPAPDNGEPYAVAQVGYGADLRIEKLFRADCKGDRIWLSHKDGNDCVTVILPPTLRGSDKTAETAIIFIDGDVPDSEQNATGDERMRGTYTRMTETLSAKFGIPLLVVARSGVLGSSGMHAAGGRRDDTVVIDAALDELKRLYGLKRLVMVGQSGGSRMIAQLLVLGRRDIVCGVMGSGAYDVPRLVSGERSRTNIFGEAPRRFLIPMKHAEDVQPVRDRRLFIVGDPRDQTTLFEEQKAWAAKLASLGHHSVLIESENKDEKHHGASRVALEAAGLCAQAKPDADVIAAAGKRVGL